MIEAALVAGFTEVAMDVRLESPMPTPAVGLLTRSLRTDLGVIISASHNPFGDNRIKLFGPGGHKLSEASIEALIAEESGQSLARPERVGRAHRLDDATPSSPRACSRKDCDPMVGRSSSTAPTALHTASLRRCLGTRR